MATLDADRQFAFARRDRPQLARFESPGALVSFLASTDSSLDEKDAVYSALVELVQCCGRHSELALSVAMLGLWPGLDGIYRRDLRFFPSATDELVSEICDLFTSAVAKANLDRIRRVAATLVRNVERDLRRRLQKKWAEERCQIELPDDDFLDTDGVIEGAWAVDSNEEASIRAVRGWLDAIVETDRELLERVLVRGETQKEAGEALGLGHDAARKRYQRALDRLSHSVSGTGVSPVKGARRP